MRRVGPHESKSEQNLQQKNLLNRKEQEGTQFKKVETEQIRTGINFMTKELNQTEPTRT